MPRRRALPNLENCPREEFTLALKCAGRAAVRRMMAMLELGNGVPFETVLLIHDICERTLERWIADFNGFGIDGLLDEERTGRPPAIAPEKRADLKDLVLNPARAGYAHWTGRKFHGWLRRELGEEVSYRTVIRFLHEENFRLKVPQPWSDRQDEALREAFRRDLAVLVENEDVDLWFGDETGIEGDPRPRRRWAQKGEKARVTKNGEHLRMNVCGIVAPRTGEAYLLEFTHSDSDVFQAFLDEANKDLRFERQRQILILDNASWHKGKGLDWGRFEPMYLPPYSPDLNPIEKLWLVMKAEWFTDFVAKDIDALTARLDQALCWAINRQNDNQRTCAIPT